MSGHAPAAANTSSRSYDNRRRRAAADATRRSVLDAAGACFVEDGFGATTLAAVADRAGVSVETIKKSIGTKQELLVQWFDARVAGDEGSAVASAGWVGRLDETPSLLERIDIAAEAVTQIHGRAAAAVAVASAAAHTDPAIAEWWEAERGRRRSDVVAVLPLVVGGEPTAEPIDEVADVVYALSEAHVYLVLTDELGWSDDRYRRWLAGAIRNAITTPGATP